MCRAEHEPDGPRRCPGDMRLGYARAARGVKRLERAEDALLSELADLEESNGAASSAVRAPVSFADKSTRTEDIRREIDTAIAELGTGPKWQEWLDFQQRFHRYSMNNQLLILAQRPDAQQVAGFNKWKELGRSVDKGEKAIWIYAPMVKKVEVEDANGSRKESKVIGFKPVPVYDVASTSGKPLPQPPQVPYNRASGRAPEGMHEDLAAQVGEHGYALVYKDLGDDPRIPDGSTDPVSKTVTINSSYSHAHQAKTLAHELAHIELGHTERTGEYHTRAGGQRSTMEVEAESVSYVVARRYGLREEGESFAYIESWARGDVEKTRKTAEAVCKATDRIMGRIKRFQEV
jgi:N-terminal domain of anti-restriction factor ArdC/IrrE N-terminal-like domain